jgi:hypothetical protein
MHYLGLVSRTPLDRRRERRQTSNKCRLPLSYLRKTGLVPRHHVVISICQVIAGHLQAMDDHFSALYISTEPFRSICKGSTCPEKNDPHQMTQRSRSDSYWRVNKRHHFGLWRVVIRIKGQGARLTAKQLTAAEEVVKRKLKVLEGPQSLPEGVIYPFASRYGCI